MFLSVSNLQLHSVLFVKDNHPFLSTIADIIIIIIIIYLLKQEDTHTHDQHENKSRTRKAQKTGAYILPIKKGKKTHSI